MATKPKTAKKNNSTATPLDRVTDYRHKEAKRKNNPPAKIAAEGTVPLLPKIQYEYSPRLAPALRFDPAGKPDKLPELLQQATRRPLTKDEAKEVATALRNQEPWLEWAAKREKHSFEVDPVALHIHERVSPQAILRVAARQDIEPSLFADPQQKYHEAVQFYRHEIPWTNRLILGDSLQVMTSLSRREDLAGKVQMIYMDPPYGIKFASNFQPQIRNREVKDKEQDLTRELETVKAYRDTWHLGIHSYLGYLRDRLIVARELLADRGSIFVQIGDENLHRVRALLEEVFGERNFVTQITVNKAASQSSKLLASVNDFLLWFCKNRERVKYRELYSTRDPIDDPGFRYICVEQQDGQLFDLSYSQKTGEAPVPEGEFLRLITTTSQTGSEQSRFAYEFEGKTFTPPGTRGWSTNRAGLDRLNRAGRLASFGNTLAYKRYHRDSSTTPITNLWIDVRSGGFQDEKVYVVQTATGIVERCLLMVTDPGDLVLDPTCGSGTTAFAAEKLGRRWITIDTSRVSVSIARQRLLTAKFDLYEMRPVNETDRLRNPGGSWLMDPTGRIQEASVFKCKTVPSVTLRSVAQNTHLDPIIDKYQPVLDGLLSQCNAALAGITPATRNVLATKLNLKQTQQGRKAITDADRRRWNLPESEKNWGHWQVPFDTDPDWPANLRETVTEYRKAWHLKMDEVNACITANAEHEELTDKPELAKGSLRVSGPFTVEAVQPPEMSLGQTHVIKDEGEFGGAPESLETFPPVAVAEVESRAELETRNIETYLEQMTRLLKLDGVRFPNNKQMNFQRLEPVMDGSVLHAEGRWFNGEKDKDPDGKANIGVVFGPQYGPVTALQVEDAVRQASRHGYDHLVIAGFSFDGPAQAVIEEAQHPKLKIHAAHIRPDVNPAMNGLLKEQAGSQLFTVFGQPRTRIDGPNKEGEYTVTMEGVDIYNPVDNSITPTKADKVAAWFLDGDYDGRTFCITQAFFPDKDAWGKLSKALDGVVDPERFEALSGTKSLPFPPGKHKTVAIKVIDPRGNEVMSVHKLDGHRG